MNTALALPAFHARRQAFAAPRRHGLGVGVVLLHLGNLWALLHAPAMRRHPPPAEPVAVRLLASVAPAPAQPWPGPRPPNADQPIPLQQPQPPQPPRQPAAQVPPPPCMLQTITPPVAPGPAVDAPAPAPVAVADPAMTEATRLVATAVAAPPEPPPATSTPAPAPAPKQIPPSAVQYLQRVLPVYSQASVRAREAGRVVARVLIDETGQPRKVQLQQSSRFLRLDEACTAAVSQSRFKPSTDNGQATAGWALVPCDFEL